MVLEAAFRSQPQNDWITLVLLFVMGLFFVASFFFENKLPDTLKLILFPNTKQRERKDFSIFFDAYNLLLIVIHICVISLFLYFFSAYFYKPLALSQGVVLFKKIVFSYIIYILFYYSVHFILKEIFQFNKAIEQLTFLKFKYLNTVVLILFPFIILVAYANKWNVYILKITIVIALLLVVWRTIVLFTSNKNLIFNKLFYFILYLCTLEITPLVVIYKIMD